MFRDCWNSPGEFESPGEFQQSRNMNPKKSCPGRLVFEISARIGSKFF
jgi:hypothetical protein